MLAGQLATTVWQDAQKVETKRLNKAVRDGNLANEKRKREERDAEAAQAAIDAKQEELKEVMEAERVAERAALQQQIDAARFRMTQQQTGGAAPPSGVAPPSARVAVPTSSAAQVSSAAPMNGVAPVSSVPRTGSATQLIGAAPTSSWAPTSGLCVPGGSAVQHVSGAPLFGTPLMHPQHLQQGPSSTPPQIVELKGRIAWLEGQQRFSQPGPNSSHEDKVAFHARQGELESHRECLERARRISSRPMQPAMLFPSW